MVYEVTYAFLNGDTIVQKGDDVFNIPDCSGIGRVECSYKVPLINYNGEVVDDYDVIRFFIGNIEWPRDEAYPNYMESRNEGFAPSQYDSVNNYGYPMPSIKTYRCDGTMWLTSMKRRPNKDMVYSNEIDLVDALHKYLNAMRENRIVIVLNDYTEKLSR